VAIPHISHVILALLLAGLPLGRADIQSARTNYDKARFEDVVKVLRDADFSTLEKTDASNGLFMLGVSELALNNDALSQKAFVRVFSDDPDFEPPQSSRKVMNAIDRARKQVVMAIRTDMQGNAVRVCGTALPRRAQIKVVFTMPTGEEGGYATPDDRCFTTSPQHPDAVNGYYVTVSVDGDIRATAGSRAWPLAYERGRTPIAAAGKNDSPSQVADKGQGGGTPWYKHWVTWTIVGVVAAGAITGTAVYFATRPGLGKIDVVLVPPSGSR